MDILDIDEVLKDDSFCLLSVDTTLDDVTSILQQWKQNELSMGSKGPKLVDTRTFTRPKKKTFEAFHQHVFQHSPAGPDMIMETESLSSLSSSINLQIGGLVSASPMQRSLIGDISPPSSICSSVDYSNDRMNSSLITSSDFTNVSFFMNNVDDVEINGDANFNGYNLSDVIKDRQFLENLTFSDDHTLTKDANISKTDNYLHDDDLSGSITPQNSTITISNDAYKSLNKTETILLNATFDQIKTNRTFDKNNEEFIGDTTFNLLGSTVIVQNDQSGENENIVSVLNESFVNEMKDVDQNATFQMLPESISICDKTFEKPYEQNGSFVAVDEKKIMNETFENPVQIKTENGQTSDDEPIVEDEILPYIQSGKGISQSTPKPNQQQQIKTINFSPINISNDEKCKNHENNLRKSVNKIESLEKYLQDVSKQISAASSQKNYLNNLDDDEDDDEDDQVLIRQMPVPLHFLRDEERQSLANFEEYEKSLSLLENNKNEREFDDLLNSLGGHVAKRSNEKMRQSLDYIKKRHSLINLEKQQEELRKRESNDFDNVIMDTNKLNDSMGKSMHSSSGSERLLNRRSRLNDDVQAQSMKNSNHDSTSTTQENITETATVTPTIDKDNKDVNDENITSLEDVELIDKNNRDRFKTIRIFRNPNKENSMKIPDADETNVEVKANSIAYGDRFARRDDNSPKSLLVSNKLLDSNEEIFKKPIDVSKLRSLSRPRYFSGIARPSHLTLQAQKSSSADDLLDKEESSHQIQQKQSNHSDPSTSLKSPMGTKSKSIHNLTGGTGNGTNSKIVSNLRLVPRPSVGNTITNGAAQNKNEKNSQSNLRLVRPSSSNVNRPSTVKSVPDVTDNKNINMRAPNSRRIGLMRPSSGQFNFSVKRNDSDIESGRFSPNSLSSSSNSSKGSLCQPEIQSIPEIYDSNKISNAELETRSIPPKFDASAKSALPRPSGLRLPSNFRPTSGKSGLPRLSAIPRR